MKDELLMLKQQALAELATAKSPDELKNLRVKYLGRLIQVRSPNSGMDRSLSSTIMSIAAVAVSP